MLSGPLALSFVQQDESLIRKAQERIKGYLVGRSCRVKSNHNGQPFGRSRKSWKGQVCVIRAVWFSDDHLSLQLEEHQWECAIPLDEVELLP